MKMKVEPPVGHILQALSSNKHEDESRASGGHILQALSSDNHDDESRTTGGP